jgi:hypothetical protein
VKAELPPPGLVVRGDRVNQSRALYHVGYHVFGVHATLLSLRRRLVDWSDVMQISGTLSPPNYQTKTGMMADRESDSG